MCQFCETELTVPVDVEWLSQPHFTLLDLLTDDARTWVEKHMKYPLQLKGKIVVENDRFLVIAEAMEESGLILDRDASKSYH